MFMNICVFLGSHLGSSESFKIELIKLGKLIVKNNYKLVFGGSNSGLMGVLADTIKEENGYIIGIEPKMFANDEYLFNKLDELIITETMNERIDKMIELSAIFILFPGGIGSLEEISHLLSMDNIKTLEKEIIIYNFEGYYDNIISQLSLMVKMGFYSSDSFNRLKIVNNFEELRKII